MDARFEVFGKNLFSPTSVSMDRDAQTPDQNQKLDQHLGSFLRLLTDYLLQPPAFKCLEYLIRRFNIQQHNVQTLLLSALPYHATNEFVRVSSNVEVV